MNCFEELTEGSVCANCGYDNDTQVSFIYLQPKTVLNDRYAIGALLSHESDAATYMASFAYKKNYLKKRNLKLQRAGIL